MEQSWDERFTALYIAQHPQLYRLAYRWLGSRERAEDMVQTAFTIMKMEQENLVSHPRPEAWLAATLVNLLKNEQRRMANQELSLEALTEERENGGPPLQIAAPPPDPGLREILPGGCRRRTGRSSSGVLRRGCPIGRSPTGWVFQRAEAETAFPGPCKSAET